MSRFFIIAGLSALLCIPVGGGCDKSDGKSGAATDPSANGDNATPVQRAMIGRWALDRKASAEAKLPTADRPGGLGYQFNADGTAMHRVGTELADAIHWKTVAVDGQSVTLTLTEDKPGGHPLIVTLWLVSPDQLRVQDITGTSVMRRTTQEISIPQMDHLHEAVTLTSVSSVDADLGAAMRLAVSRDGRWLVVRGGSERGNLALWDLASQSRKFAIDQAGVRAMPVAISAEGKTFATADYLGGSIWDVNSGQRIRTYAPLPGEGGLPVALIYARDRTLIVAAGKDVIGWNIEDGERVFSIRADPVEISVMALFPNGRRVATGGGDTKIHLWDIPEGTIAGEIDCGGAKIPSALAVNSDGSRLAVAILGGDIHIFNLPGGEPSRKITPGAQVNNLLFLPDNKTLAYSTHVVQNWDITLIDIESSQIRATLHGHTAPITSMDLTADGHTLVSVSDDKTIRTWDLQSLTH